MYLEKYLKPIDGECIHADKTKFIVAQKFNDEATSEPEIKVYLDSTFKKVLSSKVEGPQPERFLSWHDRIDNTSDESIIKDFGGELQVETNMRDVWRKLLQQPKAENGDLLTNGCKNIFYVRGIDGQLYVLEISWYGNGWFIKTTIPKNNYRNYGDLRIFL
jgi:hypothetical protein